MAAVLVTGCSAYNPPKSVRRGGTLVVALPQDPGTLNPLVAADVWSVRALTPLFPNLYEARGDLSVVPDLAASLPSISSDGLSWDVRLRTARWSDGRPITADDVVFTVQSEMSSSLDTERQFDWSMVSAVSAVDSQTVRFQLKRADGAFLGDQLVMPVLPQHALSSVQLKDMSTARFSTQPQVTGGPFALTLRLPGKALDLTVNHHYYGTAPHLDGVQFEVVDQGTLADLMGQGTIHWAPDISAATAAQLKGLPNVSVSAFPQLGRFALVFNSRAGRPFAARGIRKAAAAAVDHRRVASSAGGSAVWGGVHSQSWAYRPVNQPSPPAPGDASLSALAGAAATLLYPLGDAPRAAAAAEVGRELKAAGAAVTTQGLPPGAFQERLASGDFDLALAGLGEGVDPDPAITVASWETPAQDPHGQNFGAYSDPTVDALLKKDLALNPTDHGSRLAQLDLLGQALRDDPPYVDLWTVEELDAFSQSVVGVGTPGIQLDQDLQSSFYARWSLSA